MSVNYYDLLGVSRTADAAAIERAYRTFSKAHHADAGSPTANSALFREVTEARDTLTDPDRRYLYNLQLDELLASRPSATASDQATYARPRSQDLLS
jgi:curved DNA-binding protein CbpA